jgi:hypothetical protein
MPITKPAKKHQKVKLGIWLNASILAANALRMLPIEIRPNQTILHFFMCEISMSNIIDKNFTLRMI